MKRLCIIPARGGSKRIPGKNYKSFLGKPVIAYAIEAATKSGLFDEVMVSTDDPKIAEIAKAFGAQIPFMRSKPTSSDTATTAEVILEVLNDYRERNMHFDDGCCLYPAAPLIRIERLKEGFDLMKKNKFTTVFPVAAYSTPILRSLNLDDNNQVKMNWPEYLLTRSQDLPEAFYDAGQFYWFNIDAFLQNPKLVGEKSGAIILNPLEVQDIDNEDDWKLAELKYQIN